MNETPKPEAEKSTYLNLTAAAKRLGLNATKLCQLAKRHPIFAASRSGAEIDWLGPRGRHYHVDHIALIECVLLGDLGADEAAELWQARCRGRRQATVSAMAARGERS